MGFPAPSGTGRRLAIVPVAAIWAALVAWSLVNANQDARAGLSKLENVRADFALDDLESGYVQTVLGDAASDFQAAQTHLRAPWVTPLRLVPFAGAQIRSADALSSSATATMKVLEDGAEELLAIKRQAGRRGAFHLPFRCPLVYFSGRIDSKPVEPSHDIL